MVFNATFNNISAISWRSVFLAEETGENYRPVEVTDILFRLAMSGIRSQQHLFDNRSLTYIRIDSYFGNA
jgi:hypothetical protein